jgi:hypothetical protein
MNNQLFHRVAHSLAEASNYSQEAYKEALETALLEAENAKNLQEQDDIMRAINASMAVMAGIGDDKLRKVAEKILLQRYPQ